MIKQVKGKIQETIKAHNLIEPGDVVILGLSGGPDSLCLFHVLLDLAGEMKFTLKAAHINHQFRPGAAEKDQDFVEKLCQRHNIQCWSKVADCNQLAKDLKITSEEAGRKVRYDFFSEIATLCASNQLDGGVKVAIAHNKDDQAETILFRILRGTGTDGLSGIDYNNINERGTHLIRPLLDVPRWQIEEYCKEGDLSPRIDETNLAPIYGRNKIRLNVIPFLEDNGNPNLKDALVRMGDIAREDRNFIWKLALNAFQEAYITANEKEICLDQEALRNLDPAIEKRVLLHAFGKIGLTSDISYIHINNAVEMVAEKQGPCEMDFPKGYIMRVAYGKVRCCRGKEETEFIEKPKIKVKVLSKEEYVPKNNIAAFDYEKLKSLVGHRNPEDILVIRKRQSGDYLSLGPGRGKKKIQDLFVDMKVPKDLRHEIYMVAIGHEILWIPKISLLPNFKGRYTGDFKIGKNTKIVIIVERIGTL